MTTNNRDRCFKFRMIYIIPVFTIDTIINGIAYNLQNATASVANSGNYEGIVEIPSLIIVDGREYRVTSIQFNAFYKSKATEIILPEELEYIGAGAFQNSEALERIVIPKSVRYIGNLAFMNCTSLKELDTYLLLDNITRPLQSIYKYIYRGNCKAIPSAFFAGSTFNEFRMYGQVEKIESNAFGSCKSLRYVTLSESLKTIEDGAFAYTSIGIIILPKSLERIGSNVFEGSNLIDIIVDSDFSAKYISNMAFNQCPYGEITQRESINNVLYLGKVAYRYRGTSSVLEIKDGTESIADNCFQGCDVQIIKLPSSVRNIGKQAFHGLKSTLFVFSSPLEYVGDHAFQWCENLGHIPPLAEDVYLGAHAFESNTFYEVGKINYVGTRAVSFQYFSDDISYVTVKDGTTEIAAECFAGRKIKMIKLPESLKIISDRAFEGCELEQVVLPSSIVHIGERAFRGCKNLRSIELPKNLTQISDEVFYECSKLENIHIPESVVSIGNSAFFNCSSLQQVDGCQLVTDVADFAFYSCKSLSAFPFASSQITRIGDRAFSGCNFYDISLPKTINSIGYRAFSYMPLKTITLASSPIDMGMDVFFSSPIDLINWDFVNCASLPYPEPTIQRSWSSSCDTFKLTALPISSEVIAFNLLRTDDTNIKEVHISDDVKYLDLSCFWTNGIEKIVSYAQTPPIVNYWESNPEKNGTMTVSIPKDSYPLYSTASYWRNFKNYVDLDGNPIETSSIENLGNYAVSIKCENGILHISNLENESIIEVYDYMGVLHYARQTNETELSIPLCGPGIYLVRINQMHYKIRIT